MRLHASPRGAIQSVRWSPALAAGPCLPRTSDSVLPAGVPLPSLDTPTLEPDRNAVVPTLAPPSSHPPRSGGFSPGTILADRYRIVALLGRGGMGEVYRAEDLKLGNVVALKFLPASLQKDAAALAGFHAEVRNARQVSHPNVCRVYDIGEVNGQHFLTMEYIDGEDLASLLRRIGRLPGDKALETAHQICAGLAAAHDCGLLHRDLKPANIMLDGRGRVRITDFGLALSGDDALGRSETAGTPAYMAPEQIGKGEASVRSDIYSLGLVLYELFTGRLPYQATTPIEWRRAHLESSPRTPSSVVKDIDPVVEKAILRCLEKDPVKRPASVRLVAAAFPGGDPLAAALAAGETPSPEMVAASGETEGLRPLVAWVLLAGVIVFVTAGDSVECTNQALPARATRKTAGRACRTRARYSAECGLFRAAGGHGDGVRRGVRRGEGLSTLYRGTRQVEDALGPSRDRGVRVLVSRQPPAARGSLRLFVMHPILGVVMTFDPPMDVSGMTLLRLTPRGNLTQLIVVPPQVERPLGAASPPDWVPLFSAAGLDPSKWPPAQPTWTPPVYSDARAAWTGALAERPDIPMRIEAAAYRGKPVYFELIGPWTRPDRMQMYQPTVGERVFLVILTFCCLRRWWPARCSLEGTCTLAGVIAEGAFRLAVFVFAAWVVAVFFGAHHVLTSYELWLFLWRWSWALPGSASVASLHCSGALCAPPLAGHIDLLEPLARGGLSGSIGGTRRAGRLSFRGIFGRSYKARRGLFPRGSAMLRHSHFRVRSGSFWARAQ